MTSTKLPVSLVQSVVDYLAKRPYGEVHELLAALVSAARAGLEEKK